MFGRDPGGCRYRSEDTVYPADRKPADSSGIGHVIHHEHNKGLMKTNHLEHI